MHLDIGSELFLFLQIFGEQRLCRVEQVLSLREILLQGEVVGKVEAINAEVLDLVRLVCHLASHSLRTVLDAKFNLALLRVHLCHVEKSLGIASFKNIELNATVDDSLDLGGSSLFCISREQEAIKVVQSDLIVDQGRLVLFFACSYGSLVVFDSLGQVRQGLRVILAIG